MLNVAMRAIGMALVLYPITFFRSDMQRDEDRCEGNPSSDLLNEYDYIVIGAGSSGAVVASRLSEDPSTTVLLIEAGGPDTALSEIPAFWPSLIDSELDWRFKTVPSTTSCLNKGGVCNCVRGKVLGGSSAINAMMYVRGNRRDFDTWEALGNSGWSFDDVLPYFKKSENIGIAKLRGSAFHGIGGGMDIEHKRNASILMDVFLDAGRELRMKNADDDPNGRSQFGFSRTQATLRDGIRCSTNKAFLRDACRRQNLHISAHSFVEKILIDSKDKRAFGVRFERDGRVIVVRARREVVLSAGAIQSPQLLMVSGIGPSRQLAELGIPLVRHSPGVGENLQDTFGVVLAFEVQSARSLSHLPSDVLTSQSIRSFVLNETGPLLSYGVSEAMAFVNSKYQSASLDWPDLLVNFVAQTTLKSVTARTAGALDGFRLSPYVLRPYSRGTVRLRSSDPRDSPLIDPNFFSDERDLRILIEGVRFCQRIVQTNAFKLVNPLNATRTSKFCIDFTPWTDEWIICLARAQTRGLACPTSTCKMGPANDRMAVVDDRLRVHGIRNLRVIDASVMPRIVSAKTHAAAVMIGEKGADMIKEDHLRKNLIGNQFQLFWKEKKLHALGGFLTHHHLKYAEAFSKISL